jgi:hypothetical protein
MGVVLIWINGIFHVGFVPPLIIRCFGDSITAKFVSSLVSTSYECQLDSDRTWYQPRG